MAAPITFVVAGASESRDITAAARGGPALSPLPAGLARGTVKQSVRVAAQRGGASEVRVKAQPGEDVVVLHVVGGPVLVLHPENARDLVLAQSDGARGDGQAANTRRRTTDLESR